MAAHEQSLATMDANCRAELDQAQSVVQNLTVDLEQANRLEAQLKGEIQHY